MAISVALGVIAREQEEGLAFLLVRTTPKNEHGPYSGYWGLAGGKTHGQEEPEVTVVREIQEEMGIRVSVRGLLGVDILDTPGRSARGTMYFFDCALLDHQNPQPSGEIAEFGFFTLAQIQDMPDVWPGTRGVIMAHYGQGNPKNRPTARR
jgi:8-oxo-dGTP pyrophosphatase MutT (NUDIX family)